MKITFYSCVCGIGNSKEYYQNLSLEEKRRFYKCGEGFVTLEDIEVWSKTRKDIFHSMYAYVCIVCMYVCMYALYVCMCVCMHCMCVCMCVCMHCMYVCVCMYACMLPYCHFY